jgi:hypothetical protein
MVLFATTCNLVFQTSFMGKNIELRFMRRRCLDFTTENALSICTMQFSVACLFPDYESALDDFLGDAAHV